MTFDIDPTAPALGRAEIVIAAPIQLVWTILTDITDWPSWNTGVQRVDRFVPLEPGAEFIWHAGGLTIRSRLQTIRSPHVLGWTGRAPLVSARHVFRLDAQGHRTRVITAESLRGLYPRLFPGHARRQIEKALEQGLRDLKAACEGAPRTQTAA